MNIQIMTMNDPQAHEQELATLLFICGVSYWFIGLWYAAEDIIDSIKLMDYYLSCYQETISEIQNNQEMLCNIFRECLNHYRADALG